MGAPARLYERDNPGLSFERVAFFTDAVYAIALTLIVVGIGVPAVGRASDVSDMWRELGDQVPQFLSFFVGVLVIGSYWAANHQAVDRLSAVDRRYIMWTVVYLSFVAFLPFPIRLVGAYFDNPLSIILFAVNLAAVSTMEAVLYAHAWRASLLVARPSRGGYRWVLSMSLLPVPVFLISIPVAFVSPILVLVLWACEPLLASRLGRNRPDDLVDD
jgi:uncharacterized membrane protein